MHVILKLKPLFLSWLVYTDACTHKPNFLTLTQIISLWQPRSNMIDDDPFLDLQDKKAQSNGLLMLLMSC